MVMGANGKMVEAAIEKLLTNEDPMIAARGRFLKAIKPALDQWWDNEALLGEELISLASMGEGMAMLMASRAIAYCDASGFSEVRKAIVVETMVCGTKATILKCLELSKEMPKR